MFLHNSINEAASIIYSKCRKEHFSGIALSYGAGMNNVCIDGDTKILLLDGTSPTIRDLAENRKNDKFWIFSCKEDGTKYQDWRISPRKTGNQKVSKITLDNNEYFECTEDHMIFMRDWNLQRSRKT